MHFEISLLVVMRIVGRDYMDIHRNDQRILSFWEDTGAVQ